ncbi:zinc ribbon domain-containing protein [Nannocystis bainbridge]|uniref:Zinc ribbon domain-containing protein n=1 Tax=Nannocystis bainbridge TaxID=2995303 RepID=A0ABT5DSS2_9BACT|nr:zinc ribbon domain-containing protein [Nannocystis bainbridge]MDC0716670.1 zinc ribbon domain-containing protein [Nannocystis bainbridge]
MPSAETPATPARSACGRCESPLEAGDLRCAVCGLPTPGEALVSAETHVELLRCEGCGAAVSYDVEVRAPKCSFCGSLMHVERPEDPVEEASAYLPFTVDPAAAAEGLRRWLGTLGFFRPSDLQAAATIGELKPLWWVGWVFDAEVLVSWAADSEVGSRRASWAPHAGQQSLNLRSVLVPASRGLSAAECQAIGRGYRVESGGPPPEARPGVLIERFDVQRSAARRAIAEGLERAALVHASEWVPGSRQRKLSVAVLPRRLDSERLAFPAYVLAYRYRDKLYRAVVNGQDAAVVTGKAPLSIARIVLVIVGGLAAIALIVALIVVLAD